MAQYRDLKVGDVVYVVTEHRVTAMDDTLGTVTLDNSIVTTVTVVDDNQQIMLGIVYREQ
jgi:hypothetical protein